MAQLISRTCDWISRRKEACGEMVTNNEPTQFTVDGVTYSMDVCDNHKSVFIGLIQPAIDIATPVSSKHTVAVRALMKGNRGAFTTKDVREWLRKQGREVSDTGRISKELIQEYQKANA